MPIHAPTLLTDLKRWVTRFEDDLRDQCKALPELDARLQEQYQLAKDAGRTAFSYPVWRDGELTQSAVGWVLGCVFVRFLEDNDLLERSFLSGIGENREVADETRAAYFRENRAASDNDYLAHVMREVGKLPGMADLMDARHNALWNAAISPDAAKAFIEFWRRIDPNTGKMPHDFSDEDGISKLKTQNSKLSSDPTRFLGDLYQDLSESARKKFALLQTPDFVEEFILDRTLDPAINTFSLKVVRMIDPTCGSGHFLLGGFRRLLALWEKERPDLSDKERAVKALDGVFGVDINPFAVAIARFRLLLAAWRYCEVKRLRSAPDFKVNLAVGDSLLHGARFDAEGKPHTIARESLFGGDDLVFKDETAHHFEVEDAKELHRILGQQYHAVVGNPPYITVKDKALNDLYRQRYNACHRQYSLSVPFMERFFDLAVRGDARLHQSAGLTGQITSNSFMKREFGKKVIEELLPRLDLTHIVDTSGAFIPGHGTPTVILFGKNQMPLSSVIRTVLGINGEPSTPDDPAKGVCWQAIIEQIDKPGSESEWVSASDSPSDNFKSHPWSIGGGGMREIKNLIEAASPRVLGDAIETICSVCYTRLDEAYLLSSSVLCRNCVARDNQIEFVSGDNVRDWSLIEPSVAAFPYDSSLQPLKFANERGIHRLLWPYREDLWRRREINGDHRELDRTWWEWNRFLTHRFVVSRSISFAEIATQNHFVFDAARKAFSQTSPVIKMADGATDEEHYELLGLLNSSAACFWMKQVFYPKGTTTGDISKIKGKPEANRYAFAGTGMKRFPLPKVSPDDASLLLDLSREIQQIARDVTESSGAKIINSWNGQATTLQRRLIEGESLTKRLQMRMVYLQEELDWLVYGIYGLTDERFNLRHDIGISEDDRPFAWQGDTVPSSLPMELHEDFLARRNLIKSRSELKMIETPLCKRQWHGRQGVYGSSSGTYREKAINAMQEWLLTRLETYFHDADRMVQEARDQVSEVGDQKSEVRAESPEGSSHQQSTINNHQSLPSSRTSVRCAPVSQAAASRASSASANSPRPPKPTASGWKPLPSSPAARTSMSPSSSKPSCSPRASPRCPPNATSPPACASARSGRRPGSCNGRKTKSNSECGTRNAEWQRKN